MSSTDGEAEPSVGSILSAFADTSTMHGVARMGSLEKSRVVRVGWLLLVLAATGYCGNSRSRRSIDVSSTTATDVVLNAESINTTSSTSTTPGTTSATSTTPGTTSATSTTPGTTSATSTTPGTTSATSTYYDNGMYAYIEYEFYDESVDVSKKERSVFNTDEMSTRRIRSHVDRMDVNSRLEVGHHLSKMLIACRYKSSIDCWRSNFTAFYNHYYGNCYTFNKIVEAPSVSKPGPVHGLSLMLNVESEEYMKYTETVGFKVVIHPKDSMPFPEDEGIIVSPGFATSIAVKRLDVKRSPPPHGDCRNYAEKENRKLNMYALPPYKVHYSDKACQRTCFQRTVVKKCNCCDGDYPCGQRNPAIPDITRNNVSHCHGKVEVACLTRIRERFETGELGCEDECEPACFETTFAEEVSMGVWPSERFAEELPKKFENFPKELLNFTDLSFFRKNVARLDIYFKQLNYEKIESVPAYDWYRLLSDLGGQLGLWLGFSLLTAVEFLELALVVIRHVVRNLQNTGNTTGRASTKNEEAEATPV